MIGVLIVTHGRFGEALLESAGMLVSDLDQVRTVSFLPGQGVEDLEAAVGDALRELGESEGILALVDIPGGTPARVLGGVALQRADLELVSGVNLAMLVEVLFARLSATLPELVGMAVRGGWDGIRDLGAAVRHEATVGGDAPGN
ncbi:PTS sugar transporter subunit IIA [Symbiobacterium thermophilum]|uniref:PTS system mannose-specific IIA component n=2 Tax=Symbiobacterium thermophilum TaxID=2734 RepID=Q67PY1_SYMTH|nr:PTS system mannose-specific IIA component [Symbiobacterium thermophilum]MBY6275182.1 hypothetical protein [Symbiobacterium thermophilum]BAD40262.1 PTS system mannose-specific IIA component [Symbiobacterium thermophilum IAM 14863]